MNDEELQQMIREWDAMTFEVQKVTLEMLRSLEEFRKIKPITHLLVPKQ